MLYSRAKVLLSFTRLCAFSAAVRLVTVLVGLLCSYPALAADKSPYIGDQGGTEFEDISAGVLVGMRVWEGDFSGHTVLSGLQPLFRVGEEVRPGRKIGSSAGMPKTIEPKAGYAIGNVYLKAGQRLDGFQMVYMRLNADGTLNKADRVTSEWVGGEGGSLPVVLGDEERPVYGVFGRAGGQVHGLGLVFTPEQASSAAPASGLTMVGSRRGRFLGGLGVSYETTGTWAGMRKMLDGGADVAVIDLDWGTYSQIVTKVATGNRAVRVAPTEFSALRGVVLGNAKLYFAHNLDGDFEGKMNVEQLRTLLTARNWGAVGGPNAPVKIAEWENIGSDYYTSLNADDVTPAWLFLKKSKLGTFGSWTHLREQDDLARSDYFALTDRLDAQSLSPKWKVGKEPILKLPLFAIYKAQDQARVMPELTKLRTAAAAAGDLELEDASAPLSEGTGASGGSKPTGAPALTLPSGWETPLQGGSSTMQDLSRLFGTLAEPGVDLAAKPGLKLMGDVEYLAPLTEALAKLRLTGQMLSKNQVTCPGFPRYAFFYYGLNGAFEGHYNRMYIVTDRADRVVAIQLVDETPRNEAPPYLNKMDWYTYNFVNTRSKSSTLTWVVHKVEVSEGGGEFPEMNYGKFAPDISKVRGWGLARVDSWLMQKGRSYGDRETAKENVRLYVPRPIVGLILKCVSAAAR